MPASQQQEAAEQRIQIGRYFHRTIVQSTSILPDQLTSMYNTPHKSPRSPRARQTPVDDGAIQELVRIIDTTPVDQWSKRTNAFESLVASIPQSTALHPDEWFNSPKALRHLAPPIGYLLKDSRSTVVKRTCESCTILFEKCGGDARYLLKDIMPAILGVHAQTVQVIRTYVQSMICEALPQVPCKAVMPLWLERLKVDKSRTVREACALYLIVSLDAWNDNDDGYLTREIWSQVGGSMVRSLRDPNPVVREYVKQGLELFQTAKPDIWDAVISDPSGPASRDPKLRRFLQKMGEDSSSIADDLSVASRGSMASLASNRSSRSSQRHKATSSSSSSARPRGGGLGPPMRVTAQRSPRRSRASRSVAESPVSTQHPTTATNTIGEQFSFETTEEAVESPFMAGVHELKRQASEKRSRRSSLMKDRWSRSNSNLEPSDANGEQEQVALKAEPEHMAIARKLLRAHKKSVDGIMEIIRLEMDTLEDFEKSVRRKNVSEDDVLTYFEALGLCLDRRGKVSKSLADAMDTASGGTEED